MIYNDMQGQDHKVAAAQESTAQNSAKQGNDLFSFINQDNFKKACEVFAKTMTEPGSLGAGYFENYFKLAAHFVKKARMSEDKRDLVLHAMALLMKALVPADEYVQEEF